MIIEATQVVQTITMRLDRDEAEALTQLLGEQTDDMYKSAGIHPRQFGHLGTLYTKLNRVINPDDSL